MLMERLLNQGVEAGVFPSAQAALLSPEAEIMASTVETYEHYDLASLTKLFTTALVLHAIHIQMIQLEDTLCRTLPETQHSFAGSCTFRSLLSHRSGLAAWNDSYIHLDPEKYSQEDALNHAKHSWIDLNKNSTHREGNKEVYSDLGFIFLGYALESIFDQPLYQSFKSLIIDRIGLTSIHSPHHEKRNTTYAPTELDSTYRHRLLIGEVHDENAYALGGLAGHAGLFGNAKDVATLGMWFISLWHGRDDFISKELMQEATQLVGSVDPKGHELKKGLGFETKTPMSGEHMGPRTFGHLGFTGTSLWCDPERNLSLALLTNRVNPTRENTKIRTFRPMFYTAVTQPYF